MKCVYQYKGQTFESAAALDDFLIERLEFESKFGDIVFSKGRPFLRAKDKIENEILKDSEKMESLMAEARNRSTSAVFDGDEVLEFRAPYIGVNRFLAGLAPDGQLLIPEFRLEQEYFPRRIESWTKPLAAGEDVKSRFTDDEIDVFFEGNNHEEKLALVRLLNPEETNLLKELMKSKWKFLANAGTTLHYVLLQYFTKASDGMLWGDKYKNELVLHIKDHILADITKSGINWSDNLINDEVISQLIVYADKLKEQFRSKYGADCEFYPELKISHKLDKLGLTEIDTLFGIIDLAILDEKGQVHYFDYKSSPKDYSKFDSAKKRTFMYLLAMYGKLLRKYGLDYRDSDIGILPILFLNLELLNPEEAHTNSKKAKFGYSDITYPITNDGKVEIMTEVQSRIFAVNEAGELPVLDVLDDYLSEDLIIDAPSDKIIENVNEQMSEWFPNYNLYKAKNDEEIKLMLQDEDALKPVERNGKQVYVFKPKGSYAKEIVANSEFDLIEKVKKLQERWEKNKEWMSQTVVKAIKTAQKGDIDLARQYLSSIDSKGFFEEGGLANWFTETIGRYCNKDNWEIVEHDSLKHFGIIVLRNKLNSLQIDIIKMSGANLYYNPNGKNNKRSLLTGAFQSDMNEETNLNSLMLKGYKGNMELIETMLVLNNLPTLFKGEYSSAVIGDIQIINSFRGKGISAQNEELLYSFQKLNLLSKLKAQDNISGGLVKFGTAFEIAYNAFIEAMNEDSAIKLKPSIFNSASSELDAAIDGSIEDKKKALRNIIYKLENTPGYEYLKSKPTREQLLTKPEARLYYKLLNALAALDGVIYRLQIDDHDKWMQEKTFKGILTKGVSGTYTDNPGNLLSDTLNSVTKLVTRAYLNIRNAMSSKVAKIRNATEKLKKHKGYTGLALLGGNATDMYKKMTKMVNGDFLFTDLKSAELDNVEREYLQTILEIINENRFGKQYTKELLEHMRDTYDPAYYRVPLVQATAESQDYVGGMEKGLKERLKRFRPKNALNEMKAAVEGIFTEDDESYQNAELLFVMNNRFDRTEGKVKNRLDALTKQGESYFEHNLEVLAFKHSYAYESAKSLNEVFPLMKAAMGFLANAGITVNKNFENDTEYLESYMKSSVKGLNLLKTNDMKLATLVASKLKLVASFLALGFSPVQGAYQSLQGIWHDISIAIRDPNFTFKDMWFGFRQVVLDLWHFHTTPTKCQLINEWLSINDMDMNLYADRMRTDQYNKYNFVNFAYKFASRPDFYNRMTIVVARMKHDGIWDAISVKDGQLVYDWKKDKRFEAYANGRTGDPNYKNQQALYYSIALQFVTEGVNNPDGTKFEIGQPLPYAWTNQDAESVKSLCDLIYGYYSHEKKSLIHSTFLGSLYMQMKTYWSGKKNQYLAPGGVRIQGKWEQAVDTQGNPLYYQLKDDGSIDYNQPPTITPTECPFYLWKGQWQEGVILTLSNIFRNGLSVDGIKQGLKDTFNNEDPSIRAARRANGKLFVTDAFFYLFIGMFIAGYLLADWDKELRKEAKESGEFGDALKSTGVHLIRLSFGQSADDFNWWTSIGNPAVNWSPFSITQIVGTAKRSINVLFGDTDAYDGIVNSFATGKLMRPLFDYLKPEEIKPLKRYIIGDE